MAEMKLVFSWAYRL